MPRFKISLALALGALMASVALVPTFALGKRDRDGDRSSARCDGETATIVKRKRNSFIRGTNGDDVIIAGRGNDRIKAKGGDDRICAGPGRDTVDGGGGNDRILGKGGRDRIFAGDGNDFVFGGPKNDRLFGGPGQDDLKGNGGRDICDGDDPGTGEDDGAPDFAACEVEIDVDPF